MRRGLLLAALLIPALMAAGCDGDGGASPAPQLSSEESYPEGDVRIEVELLDTGLLKGTAYAEAAAGWSVLFLGVTAQGPDDESWQVIEIPRPSGERSAEEFFEVLVQELPRGEQIRITATATFRNNSTEAVAERAAMDLWPP
jgi:hypothetical protein